ncbi:hypothetical protein R1flu_009181 [Riccia fluitans]|uniref:Uncharacterized protein n=1 Tax=Riccia fluitans TaxID=41844 RepID=A0ABD1Z1C6_9MARC
MKTKLTGKVPDRDWVHEAKQRWKANPSPKNMRKLSDALEEHEDQIVVQEKMFLKHTKYLIVTNGDEEAPDLSRVVVILCHRNNILYTSAERQHHLKVPFANFSAWNCVVSFEGDTINVPQQFKGEQCALFVAS